MTHSWDINKYVKYQLTAIGKHYTQEKPFNEYDIMQKGYEKTQTKSELMKHSWDINKYVNINHPQ